MNGTTLTEGTKGNEGITGEVKAALANRIPVLEGGLQSLGDRRFMRFRSPVQRRA